MPATMNHPRLELDDRSVGTLPRRPRPPLIIDVHPGFTEPRRVNGRPARRAPSRRSGRRHMRSFAVAAFLVAILAAAVLFREALVAAVPAANAGYAAIGLAVHPRTIELRDVVATRVYAGGWEQLRVEGTIANDADRAVAVPAIELAVLGSDGRTIGGWQAISTADRLAAGGTLRFATIFPDLPSGASNLVIRFDRGSPQPIEAL